MKNSKSPRTQRPRLISLAALVLGLAACGGDDAQAELNSPAPADPPSADHSSSQAVSPDAPTDPLDLRSIGYPEGSPDAPVTVYEFSDFGCPFCAMFAQGTYPVLREEFIETGRVYWVYVPAVLGNFRNGAEAARAGECAGEQDRFAAMKLRIYEGLDEWRSTRDAESLFASYARDVGLDEGRFGSCFREDRRGDRTRTNNRAAEALGVRATPTFVINGRLLEGALPVDQFRTVLARLSATSE